MRQRLTASVTAIVTGFVLAGCAISSDSDDTEPVVRTQGGVVSTGSPKVGPALTSGIPALARASCGVGEAAYNATTELDLHSAKFSCLGDLDDAPDVQPNINKTNWVHSASSDPYTSAGQIFANDLIAAWDSATVGGRLDASIDGALKAIFGTLPAVSQLRDNYAAFPVEQARWMKGQYAQGSTPFYQTWYSYSDPKPYADIRLRGARQYCAALKAQTLQGGSSRSMGEIDALSAKIMGIPVNFLSVEPMVSIAIPSDYSFPGKGTSDGAQAFAIPLMFGNRVRIGSSLGIPGGGEFRYPFTVITGDSEVVTNSDYRPVNGMLRYSKRYQTVTHADAYSSPSGTTYASRDIPLPPISIFQISLHLSLGIEYGSAFDSDDSRVLNRTGWLWNIAPAPSAGIPFHSGKWAYNSSYNAWSIDPASDRWLVALTSGGPLTTNRVWKNNDHHRTPFVRYTLGGGVTGSIGGSFGPLHVSFGAGGYVNGTVEQIHDVRDGLGARGPLLYQKVGNYAIPTSEIVVRPRTHSDSSLNLVVHLKIGAQIKTPFKTFEIKIINRNLIDANVPLSAWDTDEKHTTFDERSNLRLGYGADSSSLAAPDTRSQLPGGAEYPTFDSNFTVDTCLATTPPPPPAQCSGTPPESTTPGRQVCLYMPFGKLAGSPCDDPDVWELAHNSGWGNEAQRNCRVNLWRYLCSDVSKQPQWWGGQNVVAHRLPYNTENDPANPDGIWLDSVVQGCENAYVAEDLNEEANAQTWADSFFRWALCTDDATLLSPLDQGVSSIGDETVAPPADYNTPSCH